MLERLLFLDAAARTWATTHHAPWADFLMAAFSLMGRGGLVWLVIGAMAIAGFALATPIAHRLVAAPRGP